MPGAKIPILEVEKFKLSESGRGIVLHDSGRLHKDWDGYTYSGGTSTTSKRRFLFATSSSGWLKVHVVSGSTYGPTGASYYIPVFSALDTKSSI